MEEPTSPDDLASGHKEPLFVECAANFASAFPFHGRPYDFLGSKSPDTDLLEKELQYCLPNVEHLCFLNLVFDTTSKHFKADYRAFFFCWTSECKKSKERLQKQLTDATNKLLEKSSLVRNRIFRRGLRIVPGQGVPATPELEKKLEEQLGKDVYDELRYSYLFHQIENNGTTEKEKTESSERGLGYQLQCIEVHPTAKAEVEYDKPLTETWEEYCSAVEQFATKRSDKTDDLANEFLDKNGNPLKSLFAFPICVRGGVEPIAHVFVGTSLSVGRRRSRSLLSKIHHWCSYRQSVAQIEIEKARLYNAVLDHVRHEISALFLFFTNFAFSFDEMGSFFTSAVEKETCKTEKYQVTSPKIIDVETGAGICSEWKFIPFPKALSLIGEVSTLWSESATGSGDSQQTIEEVINKAISYAVNASFLKQYANESSPANYAGIKEVQNAVEQNETYFKIFSAENQFPQHKPHPIFRRVLIELESDSRLFHVGGADALHLTRCLYAAIRNAMEHIISLRSLVKSQRKPTDKHIAIENLLVKSPLQCKVFIERTDREYERKISFSIVNCMKVNRAPKVDETIKAVGTKEVIEYSLLPLHGQVEKFKPVADGDPKWITQFYAYLTTPAHSSS